MTVLAAKAERAFKVHFVRNTLFSLRANLEPGLYIYFNVFNHKPNHPLTGDRLKNLHSQVKIKINSRHLLLEEP